MHRRSPALLPLLGVGMLFSSAPAIAADRFTGSVDVGVRDVEIDGDEGKYRQHVNLDDGPRLFGFELRFDPDAPGTATPDRVEVSAAGLGGDPYQHLDLRVQKFGAYRFDYERRQSDYFYEDVLIDPADASATASNGGDFHTFDFERIRDRAALDVNVTERARVRFGFDRYTKKGDSTTVLDVQREEFELEQPLDQVLENVDVGFEYAWQKATLTVSQRWREFDNDVSIFLPGASEGSNPAAARLDAFRLEQPYGYDSRETQASLVLRPTERWDLTADVLYVDTNMDVDAIESASGLDFAGVPFESVSLATGAADQENRHVHVGTGYALTERLRLTAAVRDQHLEQQAGLDLAGEAGVGDWTIDNTGVALGIEAQLLDAWRLSGGWTAQRRDTDYEQTLDATGRNADERTELDGYYLMLDYRPGNGLTFSASAEDNGIDDPFTLTSPTDTRRYRLRAGYRLDNGFGFSGTYAWREHENTESGWDAKSEQLDLRVSYTSETISASVGASFVSLDRSIAQLVTGGTRQDLFAIAYEAESDFWDGVVRWQVSDELDLSGSVRQYRNDGSFEVDRDDARVGAGYTFAAGYRLGIDYRYVDYAEDFEAFDANIWEFSVGLAW